ncbi:hypothetical protein [Aquimarina sp. RZ0]|uniref:hypothetical protein n=1 Tax=Aquimarina sp. RZ0 TaxID=2607730 RepID=UPI0011F0C531|nr:hypothetical protein [Aquimarina sp. RZ0]KAA1247840.1 hypothetical protein F0000_01075 [Aquimarina sp. RZ0]
MNLLKKNALILSATLVFTLFSCEKEEEVSPLEVVFETVVVDDKEEAASKNFNGYWAPWMTNNPRGAERNSHFLSGLDPNAIGLKVREQSGYGIINMSMIGRTENNALVQTDWTTTNYRGSVKEKSFSSRNDYATSIEIKEQHGYGVVDARLISQRNISTGWITQNPNVNRYHRYNCLAGYKIVGISNREQSGYGVIDVKIFVKKVE